MLIITTRKVARINDIRASLVLATHIRLRLRWKMAIYTNWNRMVYYNRTAAAIHQQKMCHTIAALRRMTLSHPLILLRTTQRRNSVTAIMRCLIPITLRRLLRQRILNVSRRSQHIAIRTVRRIHYTILADKQRMIIRRNLRIL